MNGELLFGDRSPDARRRPLRRIGVVYCTSNETARGREFEKMADCEVVEVAHAVQAVLRGKGYAVQLIDLDPRQISLLKEFDWIINLTETIYGFPMTDYEIAEHMESSQINFTGSGSQALQSCLDKAVTKAELLKYGIMTPAYDVAYPRDPVGKKYLFPVIVKPVHEDGSIGISSDSIARGARELALCIDKIHSMYHQPALIEEFIEGRDITASILGNGDEAVVLPLSEIAYPNQGGTKFLTFEAKWMSETPDFKTSIAICPSELDPGAEAAIKQTALRAYRVMGCRDYARVDFRLRGNIPYVLEVNPNPCINPDDSGFVRCGKAAGISYADLIEKILICSVQNHKVQEMVSNNFLKVELSSHKGWINT